jgi:hypothetical protein
VSFVLAFVLVEELSEVGLVMMGMVIIRMVMARMARRRGMRFALSPVMY